ncbi:MAG: radical SAM protein [Candidatus Woesearchaeota archaeon]
MRVQLFFPPFDNQDETVVNLLPLGIAYIGTVLSREGHVIEAYNYENAGGGAISLMLQKVRNFRPEMVGMTCLTNNRGSCIRFAKKVKKYNPNIKVVLGGVHATIMHKQILSHFAAIDIIVMGEGELTVRELVSTIEKKGDLKSVKGLAFREHGKIIETEKREPIKDLDTLPIPNLEFFRKQIEETKTGCIYSSRGCPYHCNFCSTSHYWNNMWRPRSPKHVVDEIEYLLTNFQVKYLYFTDDCFSTSKKRVIEICRKIVQRGLKVKFTVSTRVNFIDDESLRWLKKAGAVEVAFGVESGSPKILGNIGKQEDLSQVITACKKTAKWGLTPSVLLFVGTPGENQETINETKKLVDQIYRSAKIDYVRLLEVYPGVPLYEHAKKIGFIDDDYWLTNKDPPIFTAENSKEQLQRWSTEIVLHNYRRKGIEFMARYLIKSIFTHPVKVLKFAWQRKFFGTFLRSRA